MRIFNEKPDFDFVGNRFKFFALSGLLLGVSVVSLATRGLNWGIDFTGGSIVQLTFEKPQELQGLRSDVMKAGYSDAIIQQFTGSNAFSIRLKGEMQQSAETIEQFLTDLREVRPSEKFVVDQKEFVGPTVGRHLYKQALFAVVFSMLGIVAYVAFRFSNPLWGFAGILALGHDVLFALGLSSVLQLEVDLILVAAVLTIAGYSINDSIVIFDRLREKMRGMRRCAMSEILNTGINETLSRTLITSLTTFFTVLTLVVIGGSVIHDFALILCAGVLVGTYSSVAIAAPSVYQWEQYRTRKPGAGPQAAPSGPSAKSDGGRKGRRERRKGRQ
ncbi:MAG: protein translocase subunit SecF [Elusimicrobiota bacterium]